jgi:serine/threonine protein kinase
MEYYCNSSLNNFKKDGIKLSTKISIALCIAMGLRYCHSYGIVHMDIKPANILLDS